VDKKKRVSGEQPINWPKAEEASHAVREHLAASMPHAMKKRMTTGMAAGQKAIAVGVSPPRKSH